MAKEWAKRFYTGRAWAGARAQALRRDMYTCRDCGGRATEVHHIIELTAANIDDPRIALALGNLQSLCGSCHKKRTQRGGDVNAGYEFDSSGFVVKV